MTIDLTQLEKFFKDNPLAVTIILIFITVNVINALIRWGDTRNNKEKVETKAYLNAIDQQARSYNRLDDTVKLLQARVETLEKERDALREQNILIQIESSRKITTLEDKIEDLERELKLYKESH